MDQKDLNSLRTKLDNVHSWPSLYMFKFIVPRQEEAEVHKLFPKNEVSVKHSRNGKYISLTVEMMVGSSSQVIDIYQKATKIKGLIAL